LKFQGKGTRLDCFLPFSRKKYFFLPFHVFDEPMFRAMIGKGGGGCMCCDVPAGLRDHPEKNFSNYPPTSTEVMKKRGDLAAPIVESMAQKRDFSYQRS